MSATAPIAQFLAHRKLGIDGQPVDHLLAQHLANTGKLAAVFAAPFNAADWAELAGRWHDLGKYRPGFQSYIRQVVDAHIEGKIADRDKTHSAAGALHALETLEKQHGKMARHYV